MADQLSLSQLQALIKQGIDRAHPLPYWVAAEISELKVNYSGHCYLELVEKGGANQVPRAKASAVAWRSTYGMIAPYFQGATGQPLSAGLNVLVKVVVSYHELYGLSLQITDIDPNYTLGDMQRQRRETIERLQKEGVYEMNRELGLPLLIQRVAVVSSRNAAGYQDFMRELSDSPYRFSVTLFDAFMQGAGAEESIVAALDEIAGRIDDFDALVLIRGGGSQSDLGAFDSYRLCCHLAQFPLPVLTGIGHDKDQSVADLVAAVALKTPTAVAVFLKEEAAAFDAHLDALQAELAAWATGLLEGERERLQKNAFALRMASSEGVHAMELRLGALQGDLKRSTLLHAERSAARLQELGLRLKQASGYFLSTESARLQPFSGQLKQRSGEYLSARARELKWMEEFSAGQDPRRILRRGFAWVHGGQGTVASAAALTEGARLEIEFYDGRVGAEVKEIKKQ